MNSESKEEASKENNKLKIKKPRVMTNKRREKLLASGSSNENSSDNLTTSPVKSQTKNVQFSADFKPFRIQHMANWLNSKLKRRAKNI